MLEEVEVGAIDCLQVVVVLNGKKFRFAPLIRHARNSFSFSITVSMIF
jgi:hypothetical protein